MRARVRDIAEGTRAALHSHEDVFTGSMLEDVGKVITVVPDRIYSGWFESEDGFTYHPDWLDFDSVSDEREG